MRPIKSKGGSLRHWGMLGSLSTICPLDCDFCLRKGSPPGLTVDSRPFTKSVEEVERICREIACEGNEFDSDEDVGEYFFNEHLIAIIKKFREFFPGEVIDFTTNGIGLTRENVSALSRLGPIFLQVSLNSADPVIRKKVMKDHDPGVAIGGIKLLREYRIPYSGTIVAWPTIPEDDIVKTIRYLDASEALSIKVNLPGYTRFFPGPVSFNTEDKWGSLVDLVSHMRQSIECPITWEPFMYAGSPFTPVVTGVIKNSPAASAGMRAGDIIEEIGGEKILFRERARLLMIQRSEDDRRRDVAVSRDGHRIRLDVRDDDADEDDRYPYKPARFPRQGKMFGAFIHQGIDPLVLKRIGELAERHGAKRVLFISSMMLADSTRPIVVGIARELFPGIRVDVVPAENRFFGGNVMIGDLLVVSDYVQCIMEYSGLHGPPALAIIPMSAFNMGRDLLGIDYKAIGESTGIPVELLPVPRIMV